MDIRKRLQDLIDAYRNDGRVPIFALRGIIRQLEDSEDSYHTGKPPEKFVAFGSQHEGGGCCE